MLSNHARAIKWWVVTKNGSEFYYYSFGNKYNFGIVDNSSVGQYITKNFKSAGKTLNSKLAVDHIESMCASELGDGVGGLAKITLNVKILIAPALTIVYDLQITTGKDINLKKYHPMTVNCGTQ